MKEESGVDVELVKFCGVCQSLAKGVVATMWLGRPVGGELKTSEESLDVGYFPIQRAMEMVTWETFRERIELTLDESKHPFFVAW